MTATPIAPGDAKWLDFEQALTTAGLPTEDLASESQRFFAFDDGAAFGGYALSGGEVLLRSIVVADERRGGGLGSRVVHRLLAEAHGEGAREAWVLTTDAAAFFMHRGFHAVGRALAPPAVANSAQFKSLCPNSAVLMCRKLA